MSPKYGFLVSKEENTVDLLSLGLIVAETGSLSPLILSCFHLNTNK